MRTIGLSFVLIFLLGQAAAQAGVIELAGGSAPVSAPSAHPSARPKPARKAPIRARAAATRLAPAFTPLLSTLQGYLLRIAMSYVGVPYVWGGSSPAGFDCSGYTWYAFARLGIAIPRTADAQFYSGRPVIGNPSPGDLVFFQTYDYGPSHVGIYLGNGYFVNSIAQNVHVASFESDYFRSRYLGARRYLPG
jgi:cell wall-associated NlpC family hydrolase